MCVRVHLILYTRHKREFFEELLQTYDIQHDCIHSVYKNVRQHVFLGGGGWLFKCLTFKSKQEEEENERKD